MHRRAIEVFRMTLEGGPEERFQVQSEDDNVQDQSEMGGLLNYYYSMSRWGNE